MKRLKESTIIKFFTGHGWHYDVEKQVYGYYQTHTAGCISMSGISYGKLISQFKCSGARWNKKSNVHIESYWTYPHTMKELEQMYKGIKETYNELCHSGIYDQHKNT